MVYEAKFGLNVGLTRSWIGHIELTADAKDLTGFCGNFDGDIANDYVTKEGTNVLGRPTFCCIICKKLARILS